MWARAPAAPATLAIVAVLILSGCAPASNQPGPTHSAATTSATASSTAAAGSAPANAYGSFTFSGWIDAAAVGPVQPLPFATPPGAVPDVAPTAGPEGGLLTGSALGSQCFHASSQYNIDQYEVLLVFLVRGQKYLLALAFGFERPGQHLGEATPPAGGPLADAGGNSDQVRFDPEGVPLSDDPMFLGSYTDGTVVLARSLRSGSVDVTLRAQAGSAILHVTGSFVCP